MRVGETITVIIAKQEIILRPRLREGFRLERRAGGLTKLAKDISEYSLDATCEIIRGHTGMMYLESRVHSAGVANLAPAMSMYVVGLFGLDPETRPSKTGKKPTHSEPIQSYLDRLFGVATGWLGWTPEQALDASAVEIIAAYEGRLNMLRSIFGGEEPNRSEPAEPQDLDAKFKAIFGRLDTVREAA